MGNVEAKDGDFWVDGWQQPDTDPKYSSWMKSVHDSTPISAISIPGTHNTMSYQTQQIGNHWVWCQAFTLTTQLKCGIRFLDIRLRPFEGDLHCHHRAFYLNRNFTSVLKEISSFLEVNPSEAIVMRIKKEYADHVDDVIFAKMVERVVLTIGRVKSIEVATGHRWPNMGDVRGQILVIADYKQDTFSYTWDQCRVADAWTTTYCETKMENVRENLTAAGHCDYTTQEMFITFSSASGGSFPREVARNVNPVLFKYINRSYYHLGIVVMDYPGPEIIKAIINHNWYYFRRSQIINVDNFFKLLFRS